MDNMTLLENKQSDWKCELFGLGPDGIIWRPNRGNVPNWFWRKLQYLCFGNRWVFDPVRRGGHPIKIDTTEGR